MKPHEETWTYALESSAGYDCMTDAYVVRSPVTSHVFDLDCGKRGPNPETEALAKLLTAAPAMARLLLAVQWKGGDPAVGNECVCCFGDSAIGHQPDCALVAVLRAAGVIE